MTAYQANLELPWYSSIDEDARFQKVLRICLAVFLLFAIAVPLIPVPELTREERESLPPQLAELVLEKKEIPKPPPPPPVQSEAEEPPAAEAEPEPAPVEEAPTPEPPPRDQVSEARERASNSGLLQFRDDLASMREAMDVSKVRGDNLSRGSEQAARVDRSVVTSGANATSGGIDTATLSRDTGGVALSGRETTKVESELAQRSGQERESGGAGEAGQRRSDEEIRRVMDQNKDAIFAIYNRALRGNPALQGKVTVKLTIAPSGEITAVEIVSSELNDEALERRLLARIRLIAFEAKSAISTVVNYSFDFLPY